MKQSMVKMLMDPSSSFPDLAELLQKPVWMQSAACKGMSTDTFISSHTRPLTWPRPSVPSARYESNALATQ